MLFFFSVCVFLVKYHVSNYVPQWIGYKSRIEVLSIKFTTRINVTQHRRQFTAERMSDTDVPAGIFSERFKPVWYLLSIPGLAIAGSLLVAIIKHIALTYLRKHDVHPPIVINIEDTDKDPADSPGHDDDNTSRRGSSRRGSFVGIARRLSSANVDLEANPNILANAFVATRPSKQFAEARRASNVFFGE